jgi:hypothetical protein
MVRFLPESIVLAIHEDQIRLYGGMYGVRLDAALHMPQAQFSMRTTKEAQQFGPLTESKVQIVALLC